MSTNRSLNKLEFKAHMSIHNHTPVPEEETHESSNYTRDRFQKKHSLSNEDGTARLKRRRGAVAGLFLLSSLCAVPAVFADEGYVPKKRSSTNISVSTDDLEPRDFNSRVGEFEEDDRFGIPVNDSTSVGFNEDGDPSMNMRY